MELTYRFATEADLADIVSMLADDGLGAVREHVQVPLPDAYRQAFAIISRDEHQELTIVEVDGEIIATF